MERKTNHCVCNINYHIVFCPKYRRKAITGKVEDAVKQIIQEICNTYGYLRALPPTEYLLLFPGLKRNTSGAAGYGAEVTI
jgi:hypothetical protein